MVHMPVVRMDNDEAGKSAEMSALGSGARTASMRALALITPVRDQELRTALLVTLQFFLILAAYSCIKPVREAWILALPSGPEYKIYTGAAIGGCVALLVPVYAKVATWWPRDQLIIRTTLFFASHALVFLVLGSLWGPTASVAITFYIWISIFNVMIVAQFWSFAADLYDEEVGKRLFPLFALGASLGAVAGSSVAGLLIVRLGTIAMLPLSAVLLVGAALVVRVIHGSGVRGAARTTREARKPVTRNAQAFRFVIHDRYLLLIGVFSVLFTLVKTNGEYILASLVKQSAEAAIAHGTLSAAQAAQYLGGFYARFQFYVNVLGLLLQTFVVSRVVRKLGVPFAFLVLPVVALIGTAALLVWPLLTLALPAKVTENATDYSLNNTVRNILWLPTSRHAKYVAKQVIDTVFVRIGDVVSAAVVFVGAHALAWPLRAFVSINVGAILLWLVVAGSILKRYQALVSAGRELRPRLLDHELRAQDLSNPSS
jgi:AAA family ATP:ADP antiporter